jgi:hypothetical protein
MWYLIIGGALVLWGLSQSGANVVTRPMTSDEASLMAMINSGLANPQGPTANLNGMLDACQAGRVVTSLIIGDPIPSATNSTARQITAVFNRVDGTVGSITFTNVLDKPVNLVQIVKVICEAA